jgi:hypothetical protein
MAQEKKKAAPDWERIEADYRAGVKSVREIAKSQGISDTAIRKRVKLEGWERDLTKRIQDKADALVRTAEVRTQVRTESAIQEREVVEANAEQLASVLLTQRRSVTRAHSLCMKLFTELEAQVEDPETIQRLAELMGEDGSEGAKKRAAALDKVMSLGSRIDSAKKLGDTLRTLITLERDIYGLNNPEPPPPPVPASADGKTVVSNDPIAAARAYQALMN